LMPFLMSYPMYMGTSVVRIVSNNSVTIKSACCKKYHVRLKDFSKFDEQFWGFQ